MIKITDVAFTNFVVTDLPRARAFYEGVLGLKSGSAWEFDEGKGWVEYELPTGTLAITNMWPAQGSGSAGVAFEVADFDAAVADVKAKGARIIFDPFDTPVCRGVGLADPDGNRVMLHQRKPQS
jgi:predicted enzyme related to lactoylglutathione lyase